MGTQQVNLLEQNVLHNCCHSCHESSIKTL